MMRAARLVVLPWSLLSAGCIAFNEQCEGFIENPKERVGFLAEEVFLDKPNTRHNNNALGHLAADAFVDAFKESSSPADFGIQNGGGIRGEGLCVVRNVLPKGPLTNGLLHEIFLFENLVFAVDVGEREVVAMFEHSVSRLLPTDDAGRNQPVTSPPGQYLHVSSGIQMTVDCKRTPRVVDLRIGGVAVPLGAPRDGKKYRVAASSFLLGGGDGYQMLAGKASDAASNPAQAQRFGGIDSNLVGDYMKRTYNRDEASGLKLDPNRIKLLNCSIPPRPQ